MPSKIRRYIPWGRHDYTDLKESPDGNWVKFEDHEEILKRCVRMRNCPHCLADLSKGNHGIACTVFAKCKPEFVFCRDCMFIILPDHGMYKTHLDSTCCAPPVNQDFVTGQNLYAQCKDRNTDGKCDKFKPS